MSALDDLHPDLQALVGTVIHERYRIDKLLGRGGMGAVFRGHHLGLRRDVAIKVLRPELGRDSTTGKRFDREAHSISRLDHPNCVRVSDYGTTEGGVKYLVMELLEGAELQASLGQPWEPVRAIDMITQILEGLEHAHHVSIVHRDLKPENVFITRDYRGHELAKLVDFGIAKLLDDEGAVEKLTRAGTVFGTPPLHVAGAGLGRQARRAHGSLRVRADPLDDAEWRPPFVADDAATLLRMHILAPPPALPPSVPQPLAAVVMKLLEKSRNDRHASAREVIDVLEQLRPSLAGAPAAAIVVGTGLTGPASTPSMATSFEAPATSGVPPVVSLPPPPLSPLRNDSFVTGPLAAPPWPPGPPTMPDLAAPHHNPPTGPVMMPMPMSAMSTAQGPAASGTRQHSNRPWLPWAIGAGAILLVLMAFGAGQALQSSGSGSAPVGDPSTWDANPPSGDLRRRLLGRRLRVSWSGRL